MGELSSLDKRYQANVRVMGHPNWAPYMVTHVHHRFSRESIFRHGRVAVSDRLARSQL